MEQSVTLDEINAEEEFKKFNPKPITELESRMRRCLLDTISYYESYVFPEVNEIIKQKLLFA